MVGRDRELQLFGRRLTSAESGAAARGAILAGEAGIGKTRLARELFRHVRRRRRRAVWVSASPTARLQPLGAFAQFASASSNSLGLIREIADRIAPPGQHTSVFVDDVHALDSRSAALVQAIVLRPWVTALLTARTAEVLPPAIVDLWKDGVLDRVELASLGETETEQLAASIAGRPVGAVAARRLWRRTRGNPLYITHIARDWGALDGDGSNPADEMPAELVALIQQTMMGLPPAELDILDVVSLLEPFPAAAMRDVVNDLDDEVLEHLEHRGFIEVRDEASTIWLRPGHPLFAEARRDAMGKIRARRLRTRILDVLNTSNHPVDPVALAQLSLESAGGPDAQLCIRGAGVAYERLDLGLAAELAGAAARAGGGSVAAVLQGYSLSLISRGEEAAAVLAPFVEGPAPSVDAVVVSGGNRYFVLRDPDGAVRELERFIQGEATATDRAEVAALHAWLCAFLARPDDALSTLQTLADIEVSDRAQAFIRIAALTAYSSLGRYGRLEPLTADGYQATTGAVDEAAMRAVLLDGRVFALGVAGSMIESAQIVDQARARNLDAQPPFNAYLHDLSGRALLARGHVRAGVVELDRAATLLGDADDTGWAVVNDMALSEALALAGESVRADEMLRRVRETWHPGHVYRVPELARVSAVNLAAGGRVAEAIAAAESAADLAMKGRAPTQAIFALHTAVRYGAHGLGSRLRTLADGIDSPRATLAPQHSDAWDDRDPIRLQELSRAFEQAGDLISAVDAEAQAAAIWTWSGRGSRAAESRLRMRSLHAVTGRLHTPAVAQIELGDGLTRRESEIAMLIAGGRTDREIAALLSLSTRTVEGHAHRVYEKLGLNGRAQLQHVLGMQPDRGIE